MKRRAFLRNIGGVGAAWLVGPPAWGADRSAGGAEDDEFLAEIRPGIEKHRKGPGLVQVQDAQGKPIPGVAVRIEQTRHEFLFGCNFFMFSRLREEKLEEDYRARFVDLLNYATLPFYWATYEPQQGRPGYAYSEQAAGWCGQHGIAAKGHPLVWDHPAGCPRWLPEDLQEVGRLSCGRVSEIVTRFKGRIDTWDVVNEAVHLGQVNKEQRMSKWAATLGAAPYVSMNLKLARAANPQATLLVNDYRLGSPYSKLLDSLREEGRLLFDVVGLQSHMHDGGWPLRQVWAHCETQARLGRPLHFTETTIVSGPRTGPGESWGPTTAALEEKQASYVKQFYTVLFAHPAVQAVTWWDFSDRGAWQGAAAGLVRKDMSPKPVYERLNELIKGEWWTRVEGRTDPGGEFRARAFFGWQRITATLPGGRAVTREVHWERGQPNRFELATV